MRKLLVAGTLSLALFVPYAARAVIAVSDTGLNETANEALYDTSDATSGDITAYIGKFIIGPVISILGAIFMVLMVYAGFLWMTAAGNSDQVKKAKDIFINSVIGLVIVAAAFAITKAILLALTTGSALGV